MLFLRPCSFYFDYHSYVTHDLEQLLLTLSLFQLFSVSFNRYKNYSKCFGSVVPGKSSSSQLSDHCFLSLSASDYSACFLLSVLNIFSQFAQEM